MGPRSKRNFKFLVANLINRPNPKVFLDIILEELPFPFSKITTLEITGLKNIFSIP